MISCSYDFEPSTVWREEERKAAKDHRCSDCGGVIAKGERYLNAASLYDGHWSGAKRCADCTFLMHEVERTFMEKCGGTWCVYMGDLPMSWDELCENADLENLPQLRRIAGMQNAVAKARGGTRLWTLPTWMQPEEDAP